MKKSSHRDGPVSLDVLIVSSIWWASAAKLAASLLRHGVTVDTLSPPDHPLRFVTGLRKRYRYNGLRSLRALHRAIRDSRPMLIVPCDDRVVAQLHEIHRLYPNLRALIERSLGEAPGYSVVLGREELMRLAEELHLRVPQSMRIASESDLEGCFTTDQDRWVLKLDGTCAGMGVRVVQSLDEAKRAVAMMLRGPTLRDAVWRWLAFDDALSIWFWRNQPHPGLSLQQYIAGRPANAMMVCKDGVVLDLVMVEVIASQGSTGPSLAVRVIDNAEMRTAAERLVARLKLSGFHGLDFILKRKTGDAYLIELNPRCTQLGHLPIGREGDLAGAFCRAFSLEASARKQRSSHVGATIAFFPQTMVWHTASQYDQANYTDAPWDQPELTYELMRRAWRDRGFLARMYHAIWPVKHAAVEFDSMTEEESSPDVAFAAMPVLSEPEDL